MRACVHLSLPQPCTQLSKARAGSASAAAVHSALDMLRHCLQLVVDMEYESWSLENVSSPSVVAAVAAFGKEHPQVIAHTIVDAADYGTPSNRTRLVAGPPAMVKRLREQPTVRATVAEAFAAAGLALPADYIRSNTSNRDHSPCVRSVHQPSFCVTASHPLCAMPARKAQLANTRAFA
jgi:hypothetical protein